MMKQNLLAAAKFLQKKAEEMSGHEAAESPEMEGMEHGDLAHLEQVISQLSPEEQHELLTHLESEGTPEHAGAEAGEDDTHHAALAQAIQEHLAQNPEASPEGLPAEKAAALHVVKSASYIEGFLKQASLNGFSDEEAVNLYDSSLTAKINELSKSAGIASTIKEQAGKALSAAKEYAGKAGGKVKEYAGKAKDYVKENPVKSGVGALGLATAGVGAHSLLSKDKESEKTAAYYDGVFERAREYGLTDQQTLNIIESYVR